MLRLWRTLKYAGAGGFAASDIRRSICIAVNMLSVAVCLLNCSAGLIFYILTGRVVILLASYTEALLMLGIIALNYRRRYVLANIVFYLIINLATFYFGAIFGPDSRAPLMFVGILGIIFFVFDNLGARILCIGISLVLLALLEYQYEHPYIPRVPMSTGVHLVLRIVIYPIAIAMVLFIFYWYKRNVLRYAARSRDAEASRDAGESLHLLKNNFFQHISHDIRGAYFGVGSICAVIHDKVSEGETVSPQLAESLMSASQNYKYMLNHFLEFSKFKMGTVDEINDEYIDVAAEVKQIIELNKFLALEKRLKVEIAPDPVFPAKVLTDRLKINRIFYNIFVNALKFAPADSTVRVCLGVGDQQWTLTVIDHGKGFLSNQLSRIFQPYATSKTPENPEGIGLGLYITNYLAKLLDGDIEVGTTPGGGATVLLQFPLHTNRV
jgi:signal transduction histidine kinase